MRLLALLLLPALALAVGAPQLSAAMTSLVETERAFARMSVAQGRRAAFLAFFADDAVFFVPAPANAPQVIRGWPAAGPFNLDWEPRFGDVAQAGDLGYTTGPFVRTSPDGTGRILGTGWFFTVWKRQPDGTWKVAIDGGINAPTSGALRPSPFETASGDTRGAVPPASLIAADRAFCGAIGSTGLARAVETVSTEAMRLYREGIAPMSGAAIRSHLASEAGAMTCTPMKDEVSRSADLGYTYGSYTTGQPSTQSGYYVRMWKRLAGQWKIAIDLLVPGA